MPPQLPACALRGHRSPASLFRAFSSTPAVASPPREPPHPHPHLHTQAPTPSSSHRLLSINNDHYRRAPRPRAMRPGETADNMINRYTDRPNRNRLEAIETLRNAKISTDYLKQMSRRWDAGDVYSPHDLSPVEMQKWRKRSLRGSDVVDALGIRPLDMYKASNTARNFSLVQEFTTSSGQIIHSAGTSLRPVNQRKIAKMIRRVQGMGIYPTVHDHPEMIRDDFFPERR
ncbi:Ribosomal protein S18 [Metarhizium rileyi]|uniref:Small ribosomal subunit protein bS18m n=1 Tax=Metarhizium rileyi (strain RCEF 4871) TaxID=1649241 RepID=A0A162HRQ6_METRR|nr:Ribosomal protein S18 [Metarhizium rileyi RCEF 4871]TWU72429.1 hypothetical protein ED733_003150 [Metarhizium rileyi]